MTDQESKNTQLAMQTIDNSLSELIAGEPREIQERFTNALLNIAVHRLIHDEGSNTAASILWRLVDIIQNDPHAMLDHPIELNQLNG